MSSYPPFTLAYPLLNQLLDSFLPCPASSTSSTFTLPSSDASSISSSISSLITTVTSLVSSTSTVHLPPISSLLTTTASTTLPVISSSLQSSIEMTDPTSSLHPKDAVATSPNLQQYSAVRQLTNDLQRKKPRHPRRPQPPLDGIGPPVRRLVHTAVYKQKIAQYIDAIKLHERFSDCSKTGFGFAICFTRLKGGSSSSSSELYERCVLSGWVSTGATFSSPVKETRNSNSVSCMLEINLAPFASTFLRNSSVPLSINEHS